MHITKPFHFIMTSFKSSLLTNHQVTYGRFPVNISIQRSIWIRAKRERVWQAVTDPAQVAIWFAPSAVMNHSDDGKISVRVGEMDIEVAVVELLDPPRQLTTRSLPDRLPNGALG